MFENGFESGFIIHHPVFLVTYIVAIPAWIVAFAGQCAAEAKLVSSDGRTPVCGTLWFSIWIQFLALATDQLAIHRFQLAVVTSVALVFAVIGTEFIFSRDSALIAVGAGWLLTAMVDVSSAFSLVFAFPMKHRFLVFSRRLCSLPPADAQPPQIIWVLYLTSEEDSTIYHLLTAGGTGGLAGPSRRNRGSMHVGRRDSASAALAGGGENGIGGGGGMGMSRPSGNMNNGGGGYPMGGYSSAPIDTTPQKTQVTAVRGDYGTQNHSPMGSEDVTYKHQARAMYAYSASPDDPNEVSFSKGDVLDVVDNTGKWYQVRTPAGTTGIAPSNYLTMI
ncbi:SHO1 osmosensor, partial [Tremellales sp. Uapishka_1]